MEYQNEANNWREERCCCEFHCSIKKKLDSVYESIFNNTAKPGENVLDIYCPGCKKKYYYYEKCDCKCSGKFRIYPEKSPITLCMKNIWIRNNLKTYLKNGDTTSITNLLNDWTLQLRKQFKDNSLDIYGISFGYPHEKDAVCLLAELSTKDMLVSGLVGKYYSLGGLKVYFAVIQSRTTTLSVAKRAYIIEVFRLEFLKEGVGK